MTMALPAARPAASASAWRAHLAALGLVWLLLLALFHKDAAHIVSIWWNDATFNHCFLVVPLIGWLVWQRLPELRRLDPAGWWPGLALAAAGAFGWLLGEAGGVSIARHVGLLFMLQGAVIALLGRNVARGLAFPLFYALFLIPAGAALVPPMQTLTARIATLLLGLGGIPAHLEGVFITTPAGYFEVAEACAGARFLIAMLAFGALVANLCFRSWRRRAAFLAAAIVVPVLANGVRAWGTIYIAERTSLTFAAGFDHVVYGGIFFALVIALILGLGWRFFDRRPDDPWFDPEAMSRAPEAPLNLVAAALLVVAALPIAWSTMVAAAGSRAAPAAIALPQVPGWTRSAPARDWRPHFAGADRVAFAGYRDAAGRRVDLAIILFTHQGEGRELVGFGQGAVAPNGAWAWTADAPAPPDGKAERIASHGLEREVLSFYRVGSILTGSGARVKLETMKTRLFGGPQRAVAVLVSAPAPARGVSARPALDAFLAALGPIAPLADRAAGGE
jgi:exosortase A